MKFSAICLIIASVSAVTIREQPATITAGDITYGRQYFRPAEKDSLEASKAAKAEALVQKQEQPATITAGDITYDRKYYRPAEKDSLEASKAAKSAKAGALAQEQPATITAA